MIEKKIATMEELISNPAILSVNPIKLGSLSNEDCCDVCCDPSPA